MNKAKIPQHVAIIMDGNGRWAKSKRMPRSYGHLNGVKRVDEIVAASNQIGIKVLTLFAFSSENWKRPRAEVSMLMKMLASNLDKKAKELHRLGICFRVMGRSEGVPDIVLKSLEGAEKKTQGNKGMILNLAFNYGARQEMVDAVCKIVMDVKKEKIKIKEIDEKVISDALYTKDIPDPDLLIRTSGEMRISNFLLWQLSYSELYFTKKYWPEFTEKEFQKAIRDFQSRQRRYGASKPKKR
ncbi:MAG: isoprenyl transferase [Candidatus Omnitrophica bacterium]|nr:isoprenyl transferase [Candidatus Omnitrophota bacterium]